VGGGGLCELVVTLVTVSSVLHRSWLCGVRTLYTLAYAPLMNDFLAHLGVAGKRSPDRPSFPPLNCAQGTWSTPHQRLAAPGALSIHPVLFLVIPTFFFGRGAFFGIFFGNSYPDFSLSIPHLC